MAGKLSQDLRVGLLVAVALALGAAGILAVGQEAQLFSPRTTYSAEFPDASGLSVGSPVYLRGVRIGSVREIVLPLELDSVGIRAEIAVSSRYAHLIREGSTAELKILQILAGEKYVSLTPGDPELPELPPGSSIPVSQDDSWPGSAITESLESVTNEAQTLLENINEGRGLIGRLVAEPELGNRTIQELNSAAVNLRQFSDQLADRAGLLGRLLTDEQFADQVTERLVAVLGELEGALSAIDPAEGAIGDLLADDGSAAAAIASLRDASESLGRILAEIEAGRGLAGRLVAEDEQAVRILDNLEETTEHLREVSAKLNGGEGTLGALVNDPSVYQGLSDVVGGVQQSRVLGWLIRHYQKKGEKARLRAEEKAGAVDRS